MSGVNSGSAPDVHRNNNKNFLIAERRSPKHCQTGVSFTIPGNKHDDTENAGIMKKEEEEKGEKGPSTDRGEEILLLSDGSKFVLDDAKEKDSFVSSLDFDASRLFSTDYLCNTSFNGYNFGKSFRKKFSYMPFSKFFFILYLSMCFSFIECDAFGSKVKNTEEIVANSPVENSLLSTIESERKVQMETIEQMHGTESTALDNSFPEVQDVQEVNGEERVDVTVGEDDSDPDIPKESTTHGNKQKRSRLARQPRTDTSESNYLVSSSQEADVSQDLQIDMFRIVSQGQFDEEGNEYCLQPTSITEGSSFSIRKCEISTESSQWFSFDKNEGRLRLATIPEMCMRWKKSYKLYLGYCPIGSDTKSSKFTLDNGQIFPLRKTKSGNNGKGGKGGNTVKKSRTVVGVNTASSNRIELIEMEDDTDDDVKHFLWVFEFLTNAPSISPTAFPTSCKDDTDWQVTGRSIYEGTTCKQIHDVLLCDLISKESDHTFNGKAINEACCICGGSMFGSTFPSTFPTTGPSISPKPSVISSEPSPFPSLQPSTCEDEPGWYFDTAKDGTKVGCELIAGNPDHLCEKFSNIHYKNKNSYTACCACNGGTHHPICEDEVNWQVRGESIYEGMTCGMIHTVKLCDLISKESDHTFNGKAINEACCICGGSMFGSTFPSTTPTTGPSISAKPSVISEGPSSFPSSQPSTCEDEPGWYFDECIDGTRVGCELIAGNPDLLCHQFSSIFYKDKNSYTACCVCNGGKHLSVSPSSSPSSLPTKLPSSLPTQSFEPTKDTTANPSESPSTSLEPSAYPTGPDGQTFDDGSCRRDRECRNVVSKCLPPPPSVESEFEFVCRPDEDIQTRYLENYDGSIRRVSTNQITLMEDMLQSVFVPYTSIDSNYIGGLLKSFQSQSIQLVGNTWGASKLSHPYSITRHTWLSFNHTINNETDAHAICLDFDAIASDARKCMFLAGTNFDYKDEFSPQSNIDLQRFKFVNLALGMEASQSSTYINGVSEARKAVDGFIDPILRELVNTEKNSVSMTRVGPSEWWRVKLDAVKSIQRIVIHKAKGYSLDKIRLKICQNTCASPIFVNDFDTSDEIIDLPGLNNVSGNIVLIERLDEGAIALTEVLLFGPDTNTGEDIEYKVPVGDMLSEGISFGFPIWDGVRAPLQLDGTNPHIVTDVIVKFDPAPNADVMISSDTDATCKVTYVNLADTILHTGLPPNCIAKNINVSGGNVKDIQAFGNPEVATDDIEKVYGRPLIQVVALIQDSKNNLLESDSIFSDVRLYEETESSDETSMFLPLSIQRGGVPEQTSSAISYGNNDVFIQDFGGKILVSDKTATLNGNAWKAFNLTSPYNVTDKTRIKFDFTLFDETEGHAICVEDDLLEDPFVGKNVRCVMVAGTQYTEWKHVLKENIALGRTAHQDPDPASNSLGNASRAVDGNMNTYSNTGLPTKNPDNTFSPPDTEFYVEIDPGFVVTEVKISNRMDSFTDRLKSYSLFVKTNNSARTTLFTQNFDNDEPPEDGIIHFKNFVIDQNLVTTDGLIVGISISNDGSEKGYPHMIGEFIVYGKPLLGSVQTFDFHIANLFPESNSQVQYIALIQDNDDSPFIGNSAFSNIEIYEGSVSVGVVNPLITDVDNDPKSPRSHLKFGGVVPPESAPNCPNCDWDAVTKATLPDRDDGWEIVEDVFIDPKDDCYYADIETFGYNDKNRDETVYNNYMKMSFGAVSDDVGSNINLGFNDVFACDTMDAGFVYSPPVDLFSHQKLDYSKPSGRSDGYEIQQFGTASQSGNYNADTTFRAEYALKGSTGGAGYSRTEERFLFGGSVGWKIKFGRKYAVRYISFEKANIVYPPDHTRSASVQVDMYDGSTAKYSIVLGYGVISDTKFTVNSNWLEIDMIKITGFAGSLSSGYKKHSLDLDNLLIFGKADLTKYLSEAELKKYLSDFKYTPPPIPLNGRISCNDEIEKMIFQDFVCNYEPHDTKAKYIWKNVNKEWVLPSAYVHPDVFKEAISQYLHQTHGNDEELLSFLRIYPEEKWDELADDLHMPYKNWYKDIGIGKTQPAYPSVDLSTKCYPPSGSLSTKRYYCFERNEDRKISFYYTNTKEKEKRYKTIPAEARDQNNFGFVVSGELAATNTPHLTFPRYISHGESETIEFRKDCFQATIHLVYYDPKYPLPSVKGIGKLPDDCKKTGTCVVHWCGDDNTITLSAGTSKDSVEFNIYVQRSSGLIAFTDQNGKTDYTVKHCLLNQVGNSTCPNSELVFTSPDLYNPGYPRINPSKQKKRGSLTLKKKGAQTSNEDLRTCFDFPYDWNFQGYNYKMTGSSAPVKFDSAGFDVPANIIEETQVLLVDIAHEVGGALAVYKAKNDTVFAQVCSKDKSDSPLPLPLGTDFHQATISDSGTVVAFDYDISNSNLTQMVIFELDKVNDKWIEFTDLYLGRIILDFALSTHGHFLAILYDDGKVDLFQRDLLSPAYSKKTAYLVPVGSGYNQISVYASESGVVSVQVRDKADSIDPKTFENHFICSDTNSVFLEGGCQCRNGFFIKSVGNVLKKYLEKDDICVPQAHSDMLTIKANSAMFPIHRAGIYKKLTRYVWSSGEEQVTGGLRLQMQKSDDVLEEISDLEITSKIINGDQSTGIPILHLENLSPGKRYILTVKYYESYLSVEFVTICTCNNLSAAVDKTGAPIGFEIAEQRNGKIYFRFIDNSMCKNAFTFVRYPEYEEFETNLAPTVFSAMTWGADTSCNNEMIEPGEEVYENLNLSKLIVGHRYVYCVRATSSTGMYMPNPYDTSETSMNLSFSDASCSPYKIHWEASISGVVTTEPNAGSLPIEDVSVYYQLLSKGYEDLSCNGCSGTVITSAGGGFEIDFNVLHPYLKGLTHLDELPVKLTFSKTTVGKETISHKFLCNFGEYDCTDSGMIIYLKHLEFKKRVQVYDATSVLFTGKVFIDGTVYPGSDGCPIVGATVEIFHLLSNGISELLVSTETDGNGSYEAPVVLGSIVNSIEIVYHDHTFLPAKNNNYDYQTGIPISAGELFTGNDFVDTSKSKMTLEIAGGPCNYALGTTISTIKVVGCDWQGIEVEKVPENNEDFSDRIVDLPAAMLEVQVNDVLNENKDRIQPIWNEFQGGGSPLIRTINLLDTGVMEDLIEVEEANEEEMKVKTGTARDDAASPLNTTVIEDKEKIRFQYDGEIIMEISIEAENGLKQDCYKENITDADSFHVLDYMTLFKVRVDLEHEIVKDKLYCDIVDQDKYKVQVRNNVGMDTLSGFNDFYTSLDYGTRGALKLCSDIVPPVPVDATAEGPCLFDITHDGNGENAGLDVFFATGRPNPFGDYTRNILFSVVGAGKDIKHNAVFFIDGLFSKGQGNSVSLPTYDPILVLRDPPGGSSYASYQNVITTSRIVSSSDVVSGSSSLNLKISIGTDIDLSQCTGGGVGAISLVCNSLSKIDVEHTVPFSASNKAQFLNQEKTKSNTLSTTWSYTTSNEPARAGAESDVFVVPNLSVMYTEVDIVSWDRGNCKPALDNDDKFPTSFVFDINNEGNKPAFSFYSRYHLELKIIPDLVETIESKKAEIKFMMEGGPICCKTIPGSCLGSQESGKFCGQKDYEAEDEKLNILKLALEGWQIALIKEKAAKDQAITDKNPIADWFENNSNEDDLEIEVSDHSAALAPPQLRFKVQSDHLSDTMRLQIAGDAGLYEISMTKEGMETVTNQNCDFFTPVAIAPSGAVGVFGALAAIGIAGAAGSLLALPIAAGVATVGASISGCNQEWDIGSGAGGFDKDFSILSKKIGIESGSDFNFHIEHSSTISTQDGAETSISFGLADPDDGDEIILDIYHDPIFNTFVFDTVGGITRCRNEPNTLESEKPQIILKSEPSQFVFPDEDIVFNLELSNVGEHAYSYFLLGREDDNEHSSIEMRLDSFEMISYAGVKMKLVKEKPVLRQLKIKRDRLNYEVKAVNIALRSACELAIDYEVVTAYMELYNVIDNDEKKLRWLSPCPGVHWAGELKRDRSFLINGESESHIGVTVFNAARSSGKSLSDMMTDRLESVNLLYRKLGSVSWRTAQSKNNSQFENINFINDEEDDYGYLSTKWHIGDGLVSDGTYEIVLQSKCSDVGGPDEFSFYRENSIIGVIDRFPPEQYGYPLPLKEDILFGEEIKILFSEEIECSVPLTFDIKVTVTNSIDTDTVLDKEDLIVICEGRQIKIQIDYTRIPIEFLNGNNFEIEVGKVGGESVSYIADIHGNKYDHVNKGNVRVVKRFAQVDLSRALTVVTYAKDVKSCATFSSEEESLKNEISSHMGLPNSSSKNQVRVSDIFCDQSESRLEAKVEIFPSPEGRKLLNGDGQHQDNSSSTSMELYERLRDAAAVLNESSRNLLASSLGRARYTLHHLKIIPSDSDMKKYSSTEEQLKRERNLLSGSFDVNETGDQDISVVEFEVIASGLSEEMNRQRNADIATLESRLEMEKKDEMDELKRELKEQKEIEMEGKKKEMDEFKRELKEQKEIEMEELKTLIRNGSQSNNMEEVAGQGMLILIGCSVTCLAMYLALRRD